MSFFAQEYKKIQRDQALQIDEVETILLFRILKFQLQPFLVTAISF